MNKKLIKTLACIWKNGETFSYIPRVVWKNFNKRNQVEGYVIKNVIKVYATRISFVSAIKGLIHLIQM